MKCDHLDFCIQCKERQAQTIAELTAKLADLEGIDKVADHANTVIGLMQSDIDTLTAKLEAVQELARKMKASPSIAVRYQADSLISILDAPTKPKEGE